jgi:cytochrome P450
MTIDPFVVTERGVTDDRPTHAALRTHGPLVRIDAPAGGFAWVVTQDALARQVLTDPRFAKDPALAPEQWEPARAALEPPAAAQTSMTTADGPVHTELRKAHAPLFSARGMGEHYDRLTAIARELLTELADGPVDLAAEFTTRFPVTAICELLGVRDHGERASAACRAMFTPDSADAFGTFKELAAVALTERGENLATALRDRLPADTSEDDLRYFVFLIVFAGQITMDSSLGFLIAYLLHERPDLPDRRALDAYVQQNLRLHPPAPFTLWRFTTTEVELAGVTLAPRSPVLVDLAGITLDPRRPAGPDLVFGAGPHFCVGAQLAQLLLRAVADVLTHDFPDARLTVPFDELRQRDFGGTQGSHLTALPVELRPSV